MYSAQDDAALPAPGFPIRRSTGQSLFSASPWLIAAVHVLHPFTSRVSRLIESRLFHRVSRLATSTAPESENRLSQGLPRKEVIQPHLPVRLPCYDFTPIASPTFDGSLPCGLGHRLRVLPTFVV